MLTDARRKELTARFLAWNELLNAADEVAAAQASGDQRRIAAAEERIEAAALAYATARASAEVEEHVS